ncbi:MAG: hypothetical protein LH606_01735 [Cytophagaceae bacterium]|nr:hypothetical protein [Cytophagaceae bacterium]
MVSVSLKIDEAILSQTNELVKFTRQSRNSYFNEAIAHYNQLQKRAKLAEQLKREAALVRASSEEVLKEMEALENDYDY